MNNEEQDNDHTEEDNHTDNVVAYDGTNTLNLMLEWMMMMVMIMKILMTLMMFTIYLFLRRHTNPFMKAPTQIFSLLYCFVGTPTTPLKFS